MADVVAIEQIGVVAQRVQALLDQVGDGRLAGARQASEPQAARQLALAARTRRLVDVQRLPVQVGRAPQCEIDGAAGDGGVGLAVDQDEAAQLAVVRIALEGDRPVQDRKRVVEGKSVSVRVDLGGRRILKKKKKNNNEYHIKQEKNL